MHSHALTDTKHPSSQNTALAKPDLSVGQEGTAETSGT